MEKPELDISKIPNLTRVEYIDDTVSLFYNNERHAIGIYLSGLEWHNELIKHRQERIKKNQALVEAGGWPSASTAKYDIERDEKDLLLYEHIYGPCERHFFDKIYNDPEIECYLEKEYKKFTGPMIGKLVKGTDKKLTELNLKPGDRVIDTHHVAKYIYQRFLWRRKPYGFEEDTHELVHEETGKVMHLTDYSKWQKLSGKGKVILTKEVMSAIAEDSGIDLYEYWDYIKTTVERYMRRNKVLEMTKEHIKAVVELIKAVS